MGRRIPLKTIIVGILVVTHIAVLTQLRFTVWPEMLVMPYLMHRGFELYRDMIVPWTPGLMWLLDGWFSLVGLSPDRLKLLTWVLIGFIDMLIYKIAVKRYGLRSSLFALSAFVLLHPIYDGNGLWFDLAVVPLLLIAFYKQNPLFLGPTFLIKQSVVWIFPLFLKQWKKLSVGIGVSIGLSALWFWSRGALSDYWFWAYQYTFAIFPGMPGHADLATWRHWAFALFPFVLVLAMKTIKARSIRWMLDSKDPAAWSFFLLPFSLPRFGLFHFQPSIAFLSLSIALLLTGPDFSKEKSAGTPEPLPAIAALRRWQAGRSRAPRLGGVSVFLGLAVYLITSWSHLFSHSWHRPDRFLELDVYQFAARVALETNPDEPVLLVNGPELAYVLANRVPPKPWFTQFPWFLELPGFQDRVIESFKQQGLRQVIFTPYLDEGEYVPGSYQPKKLLEYVDSLSNDSND